MVSDKTWPWITIVRMLSGAFQGTPRCISFQLLGREQAVAAVEFCYRGWAMNGKGPFLPLAACRFI